MQVPGLKVVVPATVEDAQNLLYSSLFDPNPVLFFEHKQLYRSIKEQVPEKAIYEPLGKAAVRRDGNDATVVTYGLGVHWALETVDKLGYSVEVIDLRTLLPLDIETVKASVSKTHKILLLQEPSLTLGPLAEVAAQISEDCFEELDAPVVRCGALNMPVPFERGLEKEFLKRNIFEQRLNELLEF